MNVKQDKGLRPGVPVNENCVTSFRDFVTEKKTLSEWTNLAGDGYKGWSQPEIFYVPAN